MFYVLNLVLIYGFWVKWNTCVHTCKLTKALGVLAKLKSATMVKKESEWVLLCINLVIDVVLIPVIKMQSF